MDTPKKPVQAILNSLPDREEIRQRIAENLRERQTLRKLLKLADERERPLALALSRDTNSGREVTS